MEKYKELINLVWDKLKIYGFTKKGDCFYLNKSDNWAVVDFQKSKGNSKQDILFTINLGISSTILRSFAKDDLSIKPKIEDCHWRKRIGFIMPEKKDRWWNITNDSQVNLFSAELIEVIESYAIPELEKYISDESLEHHWMSGQSEGLTELQRCIYLITLLKEKGRTNVLNVVNELKEFSKGKPFANTFEAYLKELNL